MGETISSKKKEKRKHVDHVESSIFIAPGSVRSSEDLEEDPGDHKVLSRYLVTLFFPRDQAQELLPELVPLLVSDSRTQRGATGKQGKDRFIQNSSGQWVICQNQKEIHPHPLHRAAPRCPES